MTKLCGGVYCWGAPDGAVALRSVLKHRPDVWLTGDTAAQYLLGEPITLPLHVALPRPRRLANTQYVTCHRVQSSGLWFYRGANFANTPLILTHCSDEALAVRYLENQFSGKRGRHNLELQCTGPLPAKARKLISRAAIGTESPAERQLVRLLRQIGLPATSNVKIGDYFWDIVLAGYGIAIEVDGYQYHHGGQENRSTFLQDRWKANDAATRGYLVLRYAAKCVENVPTHITDQIRNAAKQRRGWKPVAIAETAGNRGVWKWHPMFTFYEKF